MKKVQFRKDILFALKSKINFLKKNSNRQRTSRRAAKFQNMYFDFTTHILHNFAIFIPLEFMYLVILRQTYVWFKIIIILTIIYLFLFFRTITYLNVKPIIPTGYGSDSNYYVPNKTNTFQGNPLPDVLLMSMKLPNVDEDVVGESLQGKDEAEHPPSHVFKYDFGGRFHSTMVQINQFHEKIFWPNSIFCNFKNRQKSIYELGKV